MRGQWLGSYMGNASGQAMINIDEVDDHYEAIAYLNPSNPSIPASAAYFVTVNKDPDQTGVAFINPIDPRTGSQCRWEEIKHLFGPEVVHSTKADVQMRVLENKLHIDARTDVGVTFSSVLNKSSESDESKIQGQRLSWEEFKSWISTMSKATHLFRGQRKPWSLCTSFHRRGRFRMDQFISKDVKQLHQRLSAITSHFFDLTRPEQNGAFFNLLQHHGYPTPLLDWSHSPYVGAFFAFRGRPIGYSGDEVVRIYAFNHRAWQLNFQQVQSLDPPFPHLSVIEFIAIDNPRLVPQQSVTTVSNLYDIEAYVLEKESQTGMKFLEAIDIPANEREKAMRDLRFMGITAGSMFPSIDGVCEEIRERNFNQ